MTITTDGKEETVEMEDEEPAIELLGAVELDGRPGLEALALEPTPKAGDRLVFVRHADSRP